MAHLGGRWSYFYEVRTPILAHGDRGLNMIGVGNTSTLSCSVPI